MSRLQAEPRLIVREKGMVDYTNCLEAMREFTCSRDSDTADELWLLQHPSLFTLGQAGLTEHLIDPNGIPVIRTDRGGQVTYHGPGQLIAYTLLDLGRLGLGVKRFVSLLEQAVIDLLDEIGLKGERLPGAPGIYIDGAKIAALGLRIRHKRAYHGLSLNVDIDLEPFSRINPCGHPGRPVTRLADQGVAWVVQEAGRHLQRHLIRLLGY